VRRLVRDKKCRQRESVALGVSKTSLLAIFSAKHKSDMSTLNADQSQPGERMWSKISGDEAPVNICRQHDATPFFQGSSLSDGTTYALIISCNYI